MGVWTVCLSKARPFRVGADHGHPDPPRAEPLGSDTTRSPPPWAPSHAYRPRPNAETHSRAPVYPRKPNRRPVPPPGACVGLRPGTRARVWGAGAVHLQSLAVQGQGAPCATFRAGLNPCAPARRRPRLRGHVSRSWAAMRSYYSPTRTCLSRQFNRRPAPPPGAHEGGQRAFPEPGRSGPGRITCTRTCAGFNPSIRTRALRSGTARSPHPLGAQASADTFLRIYASTKSERTPTRTCLTFRVSPRIPIRAGSRAIQSFPSVPTVDSFLRIPRHSAAFRGFPRATTVPPGWREAGRASRPRKVRSRLSGPPRRMRRWRWRNSRRG